MQRCRILIGVLTVVVAACSDKGAVQTAPPPEVPVYVTRAERIPLKQDFVGQVHGLKDIAIRARVEGFLEGIHFDEGSQVEQGMLLYSIESQPFEEKVAAQMSRLAEAQTTLAKAESDLNRIRPLAEQRAVSASDLDAAVAMHDAAKAGVEAAEANLRAARIQLSYTRIHSPISGIIGRTLAKVGDFVGRDPNPVILNTVSRLDTVLVDFFITEEQYLQLRRAYPGQQAGSRGGEQRLGLELRLADGSLYAHEGHVEFIDRQVDPTTGAMLVQSSFPNPEGLLRPGLFARIRATIRVLDQGIRIPQRCVSELQGRFRVFVVGADNKVELRPVVATEKIGDFWVIESGLQSGERVVVEGLQRMREGLEVQPVDKEIQPQMQEGI
jgi:membrane fusion protein (multidrug efflux system)